MSIPKIDIVERRGEYRIYWIVDGDEGAAIGERAPNEEPDDPELAVVWEAVAPLALPHRDREGFTFESQAQATKALRAARAALRAYGQEQLGKSWPEWAKLAAAAGWKAPRGWKP